MTTYSQRFFSTNELKQDDQIQNTKKFKKLLSNQLQSKTVIKSDFYNSFKTPSRDSFLTSLSQQQNHKINQTHTKFSVPSLITNDETIISNQNNNINNNNNIQKNGQMNVSYNSSFRINKSTHQLISDEQQNNNNYYYYNNMRTQSMNQTEQNTPSNKNKRMINNQQNQQQLYEITPATTNTLFDNNNNIITPTTTTGNIQLQSRNSKTLQYHKQSKSLLNSPISLQQFQRKQLNYNLNSAKIPLNLIKTESNINQSNNDKNNNSNKLRESFLQIQYLSRNKDNQFLDMLEKSKNINKQILNNLDLPTYQDYSQFKSRSNALKSLLNEFANQDDQLYSNKLSSQQQYLSTNNNQINNNTNVKPHIFYSVKSHLIKPQQNQNQQDDDDSKKKIQGRSEKKLQIKQVDFKKKDMMEIDQGLFESYLDCLKNNNAIRINSPTNNNNNNNNNRHIQIKNMHNEYGEMSSIIQAQNTPEITLQNNNTIKQQQQLLSFNNNSQHQNLSHKSSIFFNPNAFAQENYLSKAKKNLILVKNNNKKQSINRLSIQLNNSINDSEDRIIERNPSEDREMKQKQKQQKIADVKQQFGERINQQIKNNTFSVINSPKQQYKSGQELILLSSDNNRSKIQQDESIKQIQQQNQNKKENDKTSIDNNNDQQQQQQLQISDFIEQEEKEDQSAKILYNRQKKSYGISQQNQNGQQLILNNEMQQIQNRIEEIENSIIKIIDYINELKILYNSTLQFTNLLIKIPGFNDMIRSFLFKDHNPSNGFLHDLSLNHAKSKIILYLYDKQILFHPITYDPQSIISKNNISITNHHHSNQHQTKEEIDRQFEEINNSVLEEMSKQLIYFCRNMFHLVQQKRIDHQKQQVEDIKTEIKQISIKTSQQYTNISNQVSSQLHNMIQLNTIQGNLDHILDRRNYVKQQPFIEKFEQKEEQLGQFEKISEVSRNKSKQLNELNDILRNFNKYT